MRKFTAFSAALNKGQALLPETFQLALHWHQGETPQQLAEDALRKGYLGRATEKRIKDLVTVFARRYMRPPAKPVAHLHVLASHSAITGLFEEACLIHTMAAHPELAAFIREIYWPNRYEGRSGITIEIVRAFLYDAVQQGRTERPWSEGLLLRTAQRLAGTLTEFKLVGTPDRHGMRPLSSFQPQIETLAYLAYWLHDQGFDAQNIIRHPSWQLLGIQPLDVLPSLRRLALHNWMSVLTAGDLISLEWHYPTTLELINEITQRRLRPTA